MDIQQAQKAKAELEKKIAELLKQFSEETGLTVEAVEVRQYEVLLGKQSTLYEVSVEAKL